MFHTARDMSFSLPTTPCGAAKQGAAIPSVSTPCSTSITWTPAPPPSRAHERFAIGRSRFQSEGARQAHGLHAFSLQDLATMLPGGTMSKSRRQFLTQTSLGLIGAAVASSGITQGDAEKLSQETPPLPPGAPPAFGTGPAVGPNVSPATFAEAEKLLQLN